MAQSRPLDLTPTNSISIEFRRKLYIQCQQWGNGQKFIKIYKDKSTWLTPRCLPNILMPQDAYKFVTAMDAVIRQLPMEEPTHPEGDESPLVLATQTVVGTRHYDGQHQHYEFELSAWHEKGCEWYFDIQSVQILEQRRNIPLFFPFSKLPWLREQMVRMLAEHDGSERISEMPYIPEWATRAIGQSPSS